jgi:hypothetical protein
MNQYRVVDWRRNYLIKDKLRIKQDVSREWPEHRRRKQVGDRYWRAGKTRVVNRIHDFDSIVIVYYPSLEFFANMIGSSYYQGIYGDKQL